MSSFTPYQRNSYPEEEVLQRSSDFYKFMDTRRTVREFSPKAVPRQIIENIIMTASSAPSGAHKQPWTFCAVEDKSTKPQIREAAEKEEYENYHGRMPEEWLNDLKPFATDWHKDFLEIAPWLIIVFKRPYELVDANKKNNYYVQESVGLATGLLLSAIHHAGLVALTHTPSPMNFLSKVLNRPENEKPFLLIPVGYPADKVMVPKLERKKSNEVIVWY